MPIWNMMNNDDGLTDSEKHKVYNKLIDICHANLYSNNTRVLNYLYKRNIQDHTIKRFKLGAFPSGPAFDLICRYVGIQNLYNAGVISFVDKKPYSKFIANKLIIPIYDQSGNPLSIIGRGVMSEKSRESQGLPKYTNTFFKKSKVLFGLNEAKNYIREKDEVFVVEGNFDVISAYQNGLKNVVATSGTFLSRSQLILLARYTNNVKILFDNDDAGAIASDKIIKKYNFDVINIKKVKLPTEVKDLDEYFQKKS